MRSTARARIPCTSSNPGNWVYDRHELECGFGILRVHLRHSEVAHDQPSVANAAMTQPENHPNDDNDRILRQFAESGIDLQQRRKVDFAHLATDEDAARRFAKAAADLGLDVQLEPPHPEDFAEGHNCWDVICTGDIVPSCASISDAEARLSRAAADYGCNADGWGFYTWTQP